MVSKKSRFDTIVIIVDATFDAFVVWEGRGEEGRESGEEINERGGERGSIW